MANLYACYRREDEPQAVGRVVGDIRSCFGDDSIFYDIDCIPFGQEWPKKLRLELDSCSVVLAFIGRNWHKSWCDEFGPRLWNPKDWVRIEICHAMDTNEKIVIPILIDNVVVPKKSALPNDCSLHKIPLQEYAVIRNNDYSNDMEKLIKRIGNLTEKIAEATEWLYRARTDVNQNISKINDMIG